MVTYSSCHLPAKWSSLSVFKYNLGYFTPTILLCFPPILFLLSCSSHFPAPSIIASLQVLNLVTGSSKLMKSIGVECLPNSHQFQKQGSINKSGTIKGWGYSKGSKEGFFSLQTYLKVISRIRWQVRRAMVVGIVRCHLGTSIVRNSRMGIFNRAIQCWKSRVLQKNKLETIYYTSVSLHEWLN